MWHSISWSNCTCWSWFSIQSLRRFVLGFCLTRVLSTSLTNVPSTQEKNPSSVWYQARKFLRVCCLYLCGLVLWRGHWPVLCLDGSTDDSPSCLEVVGLTNQVCFHPGSERAQSPAVWDEAQRQTNNKSQGETWLDQ